MKYPIIINNYNLLTYPRDMVESLLTWDHVERIFIVDNNSTYEPLLKWYEQMKKVDLITIIRLPYNYGHLAPWQLKIVDIICKEFGSEHYVVTDPDLDISHLPGDTLDTMATMYYDLPNGLYDYQGRPDDPFYRRSIPYRTKIGLGIQIDDIPEDSLFYTHMETRYHEQPKINQVQLAPLDTTFAMYPAIMNNEPGIGGVRMLDPYTCKHIPYYFTESTLKDDHEFMYYLENANHASSTKKRFLGLTDTIINK